jgi:glycosyltransferase involved in cell wall biosynthesis
MEAKSKIAYVIGAKFPTNKAYGITSRETLEVLMNNGLQIRVFCKRSRYFDSDFKGLAEVIEYFPKNFLASASTKLGEFGKNRINHFFWKLGLVINIVSSFRSIDSFKPDIIWARDPIIAYFLLRRFKEPRFILEVHEESRQFYYRKLLQYHHRIKFCPISAKNKEFLLRVSPLFKIQMAPMAIRAKNIVTEESCKNFLETITLKKGEYINVAYVGKFAPGGYSKGINDLLKLAQLYSDIGAKKTVTLLGANEAELKYYKNQAAKLSIKENYLILAAHVKHSEVAENLKKFDVLVLPAYSSQKYNGMPIKLLEYLSSGKITIIADTELYRSLLLPRYYPFFYNPGDVLSLDRTINSALQSNLLKAKLAAGIDFASQHTWDVRTLNLISKDDIPE